MTTAPKKRKTQFAATILLVVANLLLLNWIALGRYGRVDLTREGVFTLSPATKELLRGLDDIVVASVYISDQEFAEHPAYAPLPRMVHDSIDEFAAQSNGRFQVEYKDPSADPALQAEAMQAGVQRIQLGSAGGSGLSIFAPFCGVRLTYGAKEEVIPVAQPDRLEYDLAMAVAKLTRRTAVTIGVNSLHELPQGLPPEVLAQLGDQLPRDQHSMDGPNADLRSLANELKKQFEVEKVPLSQPVPEHVSLLLVVNTKGMTDVHRFHLDQYVMRGGKVVVFAPGTELNPKMGMPVATDGANDEFLRHYGFEVHKNLVLDMQSLVLRGLRQVFFPVAVSDNFDPETPLLRGLAQFVLPFCSSLTLHPNPGQQAVALVRSSRNAWEQQGFFNLDLASLDIPSGEDMRQFDLVGQISGTFKTYFANRPLPEGLSGAATGPTASDLGLDPEDLEGLDEDEMDEGAEDAPDDTEAEGAAEGDPPPAPPADEPPPDPRKDGGDGGDGGDAGPGVWIDLQDPQDPQEPQQPQRPQDPPAAPEAPPAETEPAAPQEPAEGAASGEGEAVPAGPEGATPPEPPSTPAVFVRQESPETTMLVVGSDVCITNNFIDAQVGNAEFVLTLCDRLTTGSRLADLRFRLNDVTSISAEYTEGEYKAFAYAGMLGMPMLVLLAGVAVFLVRKTRRSLGS